MNVSIIRFAHSDQGTKGILAISGVEFCKTLELPWRDNAPRLSCIPCGQYDVRPRYSPKFGVCYEVQGVPGRKYILIHSGNVAGDTTRGYRSHVEGCILLGKYHGKLGQQEAVLYSAPTVREFFETMEQKPFKLLVEDAICGN